MKNLYLLLCLACVGLTCHAKTDSVYIDIASLKYASEFERTQFKELDKNGTFNPLHFLYCLDSTVTPVKATQIEQKLNAFFAEKISPLAGNKNTDKAIKAIFKQIHDNLLTKYVLESRFERLLDYGEYNCVTASALYAMAFQKCGIPYQLRSTTNHVYVIANPGPNQVVIETTDPEGGAYSYSEQYKKTYVEILVRQKMISKQEYNESSVEALFQKHYYSSDTIDLKQLIGYHYYNNGLELIRTESFLQGTNQLMKAYYLNKDSKIQYILFIALAGQIAISFDVTDTTDLQRFFLFSKLGKEVDFDQLYNSYILSTEDLLISKDDTKKFNQVSQYIFQNLPDTATINKFKEHYYYALAYSCNTKKKFLEAYTNILHAYCINSKNIRISAMYNQLDKYILFYLAGGERYDYMFSNVNNEEDYDVDEEEVPREVDDSIIKEIETAVANCSAIDGLKWKMNFMLVKASALFDDKKIEKGNEMLATIEKFAADNKLTDFDDRYVHTAYSAAHRYFYMNYNIPKAKEYLARGLKLDADNKSLKHDFENMSAIGSYRPVKYSGVSIPPPPPPPGGKYETKPTTPRTVIVKTPK
jgi:hypothetical protein